MIYGLEISKLNDVPIADILGGGAPLFIHEKREPGHRILKQNLLSSHTYRRQDMKKPHAQRVQTFIPFFVDCFFFFFFCLAYLNFFTLILTGGDLFSQPIQSKDQSFCRGRSTLRASTHTHICSFYQFSPPLPFRQCYIPPCTIIIIKRAQ